MLPANAELSKLSKSATDFGNVIDVRHGQSMNADVPMFLNFVAFDGIFTFVNVEQPANILSEMHSKFDGNDIDFNDVQLANASDPTHDPYG